jgi:hypothetical protein
MESQSKFHGSIFDYYIPLYPIKKHYYIPLKNHVPNHQHPPPRMDLMMDGNNTCSGTSARSQGWIQIHMLVDCFFFGRVFNGYSI